MIASTVSYHVRLTGSPQRQRAFGLPGFSAQFINSCEENINNIHGGFFPHFAKNFMRVNSP